MTFHITGGIGPCHKLDHAWNISACFTKKYNPTGGLDYDIGPSAVCTAFSSISTANCWLSLAPVKWLLSLSDALIAFVTYLLTYTIYWKAGGGLFLGAIVYIGRP